MGHVFEWPALDRATLERAVDEGGGYPDLVVHSFATAEDEALLSDLRARSAGRTRLVLVGRDGGRPETYDLLIRPHHLPPPTPALASKTLRVFGLPTRVERARFRPSCFVDLPGPRVLALIGGRTARIDFGEGIGRRLGRALDEVRGGSLMITNSRRTPRRTYAALLAAARPDVAIDARFGPENPYEELLAAADHVIVTGDSSAMIVDALETGKPVHLFAPREVMEDSHVRFNLALVQSGRVRLLRAPLETWTYAPLEIKGEIARRCRALLDAR